MLFKACHNFLELFWQFLNRQDTFQLITVESSILNKRLVCPFNPQASMERVVVQRLY